MVSAISKAKSVIRDFAEFEGAVVAFSGGVDSSVVAALAEEALGDKVLAVTSDSETLLSSELEEARRVADEIGVRHRVIQFSELEEPNFAENPEDRCYYCKKGLFRRLNEVAREEGLEAVADGTNASELRGHRPGFDAVKEAAVFSPLVENDVTKEEVRAIAEEMGLSVADKPSMACLSSRIPYGEVITGRKLEKISRAEEYLRSLGIEQLRVRCHGGDMARIEVRPGEMDELWASKQEVSEELKGYGFDYVTLDLDGYREGSMDEGL